VGTFEIASEALDRLLDAMEEEAETPTWCKADDHPNGGYPLYNCSIAPIIHWLWFEEPFHSRGDSRKDGGVLFSEIRSLADENFEDVLSLLRYLHSVDGSYHDALLSLEGLDGLRIVAGLKANNWI